MFIIKPSIEQGLQDYQNDLEEKKIEEVKKLASEQTCNLLQEEESFFEHSDIPYAEERQLGRQRGERLLKESVRFEKGDIVVPKESHKEWFIKTEKVLGRNHTPIMMVGSVRDVQNPLKWSVDPFYWEWEQYQPYAGQTNIGSVGHPQFVYLENTFVSKNGIDDDPEGKGRACYSGAWFRHATEEEIRLVKKKKRK